MKVCVIGGAGYVGLVTGLGLSHLGHSVISVDVDMDRVSQLQDGRCHLLEPGAGQLLNENLKQGNIRFSTDLASSVKESEVIVIAVGTPSLTDGHVDLSQIIDVAEGLAECMKGYKLIVIKSTAPIGTVELVRTTLGRNQEEDKDFDIVVNPEFLSEGNGLYDFFYPDRIVIGSVSEKAVSIMRQLYEPFLLGNVNWEYGSRLYNRSNDTSPVPMIETDVETAQMIKYSSNAFLATRISFINEIAGLCDKVGANVTQVSRGMGLDPRIGSSYLKAGPGFGGPCLEKDLLALMTVSVNTNYDTPVLKGVLERNQKQIDQIIIKLKGLVGQVLYGKVITVFGLAFKAGTNDVRNSVSMKIVSRLEKEGVSVRLHDPFARVSNSDSTQYNDPYTASYNANAILILTEWEEYKDLDYEKIRLHMNDSLILDTRNILDRDLLRNIGFTYIGMGV